MKSKLFIPTMLASIMAISLTACSSGGSSVQYKSISSESSASPSLEVENKFVDSQWKDVQLEPAYFGGDSYQPNLNKNQDAAFYGSGPLDIKKNGQHALLTSVKFDRSFLKGNPNPNEVKTLNVIEDGETIGSFQFVNMNYASILTFMSNKPSNKYDPDYDEHIPLVYYTAKPSSAADLARQKGTANYSGKVIGYKGGVHGDTPKEQASTDIAFLVDFDNKEISGEIKKRFDDVGNKHPKWAIDYDENDDEIFRPEYHDRQMRPLILQKTKISTDNGVVSFGPEKGETINAGVKLNDGSFLGITSYSGIFAGPELDEIVGKIGNSDEKLMFGATKEKK